MPTKTYASPVITIRSADPLRFGWGNSMQPAIQDVARVFDTLTKASPDPSERIGFWDKIRLQLHWRIRLVCPGPLASVIFHLKGSRDPYALTGFGAGFAKAWRGDVELRLGLDNPDREFFQVQSDRYVLGIPNLREYIDSAATGSSTDAAAAAAAAEGSERGDEESVEGDVASAAAGGGSAYAASTLGDDLPDDGSGERGSDRDGYDTPSSGLSSDEADAETGTSHWLKVCAKCINGVRWGMGVRLERACRDVHCDKVSCRTLVPFHRQCRFFDFIPHWQVHTKTRAAIGPHGEVRSRSLFVFSARRHRGGSAHALPLVSPRRSTTRSPASAPTLSTSRSRSRRRPTCRCPGATRTPLPPPQRPTRARDARARLGTTACTSRHTP